VKTVLKWVKAFGVIFVVILVGELHAVKAAARVVDEQRPWLLPLTLGVTGLGFIILIWGWTRIGIRLGKPMTRKEMEQLAAQTQILGPGKRFSKARLWGKTSGVKVDPPMSWTFQEMKAAWRNGTWWRDHEMLQKYVITAGGILCILGGFSVLFIVFKPPSAKILLGGAILYAAFQLVRGFRRA
jgi:hypothetical protein